MSAINSGIIIVDPAILEILKSFAGQHQMQVSSHSSVITFTCVSNQRGKKQKNTIR